MRLTRKFVIAIVAVVLVVLGSKAAYDLRRDVRYSEADVTQDTRILGTAVARAAARLFAQKGAEQAFEFIDELEGVGGTVQIRWVWLDAAPGEARAPARGGPGGTAMVTHVPMGMMDGRPAAIEVIESLAEEHAHIRRSMIGAVVSTLVLFVLAGGLVILLGRRFIGRPVAQLVDRARRIGAGDLETPLRLRQHDELGDLADEITQMGRRLAAEIRAREAATEQLRLADRLTTVGQLAAGLAHELATPLSVVMGRAMLIADREIEGDEAIDNARIIHEQSQRMARLIRELLDFARPRPARPESTDLRGLAGLTLTLLTTLADKASVTLELAPGEPVSILADPGQMQQVVTNLVVNAIQASARGAKVMVGAEVAEAAEPASRTMRRCARLWVRDHGTGMDDATRKRIFEPFYTTKEVGQGTGLGLAVSYGIVREHGGWIEVESAPGKGSTFLVCLPVSPGATR